MLKKAILAVVLAVSGAAQAEVTLLNVSYDVTREFYKEYNPAFARYWKQKTGETVGINQSHGGSSKQIRAVAEVYLNYMHSDEGQEFAARHHLRPRLASVASRHAADFKQLDLFTVEEVFGGWQKAQKKHFADGGVFDQILRQEIIAR